MSNLAYAYINDSLANVYVTLPGQEQVIFYWDIERNIERRVPRDRLYKTDVENAKMTTFNDRGCVVELNNKRAEFAWYEYENKEYPQHKGRLVNFADWEHDPEYKHNTSTDLYTAKEHTGYYAEPQPYEEEE